MVKPFCLSISQKNSLTNIKKNLPKNLNLKNHFKKVFQKNKKKFLNFKLQKKSNIKFTKLPQFFPDPC
jgi:hypothetical protein